VTGELMMCNLISDIRNIVCGNLFLSLNCPENFEANRHQNEEATLDVGDLRDHETEETVLELFTQVGPVVRVTVPRDRETPSSFEQREMHDMRQRPERARCRRKKAEVANRLKYCRRARPGDLRALEERSLFRLQANLRQCRGFRRREAQLRRSLLRARCAPLQLPSAIGIVHPVRSSP
jgi:hypothetical protein